MIQNRPPIPQCYFTVALAPHRQPTVLALPDSSFSEMSTNVEYANTKCKPTVEPGL